MDSSYSSILKATATASVMQLMVMSGSSYLFTSKLASSLDSCQLLESINKGLHVGVDRIIADMAEINQQLLSFQNCMKNPISKARLRRNKVCDVSNHVTDCKAALGGQLASTSESKISLSEDIQIMKSEIRKLKGMIIVAKINT
ncbi:hypothetical protein O9G_003234 [Rozella allomycis CSF55]|uniref:Uncharacterized protein n=1 Tax=Rozella allomycis (strain CSF55) TaxID=988480 RepID=A0A075ASX7_ROZAC|nr:hypothetical protein O9G_003234 [Rozella allomycis CSF55]|eukprot:EPZ33373.1 hypothetical protein O9G_003234 [Rozella allomycis CSF55]